MQDYFRSITRPLKAHAHPKTHKPRTLNVEKEHRRLKKLLTRKKDRIAQKLKVSFTQPSNTYGWIYLMVETEICSIKIHCSYAFEPFDSFIYWMEGILFDIPMHAWKIEEEGRYKKLFVYPVDMVFLRLVVIADDHYALEHCIYKEEHIVIDTIIRKEELIAQFYYGFRRFVQNEFDRSRWSNENLHESLNYLNRYFDTNWDRWRGISKYA